MDNFIARVLQNGCPASVLDSWHQSDAPCEGRGGSGSEAVVFRDDKRDREVANYLSSMWWFFGTTGCVKDTVIKKLC